MAQLIGKLVPEDDYTHPLGPEPNFNESMYFNFFDPNRQLGGFVRLGNRANEGRAEMTVCLFLPDGRVLFNFKRAPIENNDRFDAGGLRFEVLEPTERLQTVYQGRASVLEDARSMADPSRAFRESPRCDLLIDLEHHAAGPMYGGAKDREETQQEAEKQFGKAHYEQHMAVRGQIQIDGEPISFSGFGLRDHSWGPRYWQALHRYEWLTLNFGPDFGAMISVIQREEGGESRRTGVLVRRGQLDLIQDVQIDIEYEENNLYHKSMRVELQTKTGETLEITGQVKGFIPLRNRRNGQTTHIGEGMTEWRYRDQVGFGLSELLRQVN